MIDFPLDGAGTRHVLLADEYADDRHGPQQAWRFRLNSLIKNLRQTWAARVWPSALGCLHAADVILCSPPFACCSILVGLLLSADWLVSCWLSSSFTTRCPARPRVLPLTFCTGALSRLTWDLREEDDPFMHAAERSHKVLPTVKSD